MIVCFFDFCELLGIRMDVEGEIMQAESFPCQVQLLFVAVNNGSSANWESVKQTTRPMTNEASPSMVYTTANSKSEQLAA